MQHSNKLDNQLDIQAESYEIVDNLYELTENPQHTTSNQKPLAPTLQYSNNKSYMIQIPSGDKEDNPAIYRHTQKQ